MRKIIIAIDGYSSCGKSTLAKTLSQKLGYRYVDSGAMYRAVTLYCIHNNIINKDVYREEEVVCAMNHIYLEFHINPHTQQSEMFLNGENVEEEIRGMRVANFVSQISSVKEVRDIIVQLQRSFGKDKGIVMDGRDISTNVFPQAELKIFMTASENIRARRRWKELMGKGIDISIEEVRRNLSQRDYEDTHRKYNPLIQAADAVVLDNSDLDANQQLAFALELVNKIMEK